MRLLVESISRQVATSEKSILSLLRTYFVQQKAESAKRVPACRQSISTIILFCDDKHDVSPSAGVRRKQKTSKNSTGGLSSLQCHCQERQEGLISTGMGNKRRFWAVKCRKQVHVAREGGCNICSPPCGGDVSLPP